MTSIQSVRFKSHNLQTLREKSHSEIPFPSACLWWTSVVSGCLASLPPPSSNSPAACLENPLALPHVALQQLPIPLPTSSSHRDGPGPGPAGDLRTGHVAGAETECNLSLVHHTK